MHQQPMLSFRRITSILLVPLVTLVACGAPQATVDPISQAAALAEPSLQLTSDLETTEMLDARTGTSTNLNTIVTGDRPVLLWYWAPD